eukprot:s2458_g5.t8
MGNPCSCVSCSGGPGNDVNDVADLYQARSDLEGTWLEVTDGVPLYKCFIKDDVIQWHDGSSTAIGPHLTIIFEGKEFRAKLRRHGSHLAICWDDGTEWLREDLQGTWHRRCDGCCVGRVTQRGLLHWTATAAAMEEAVKHSRLHPAEGIFPGGFVTLCSSEEGCVFLGLRASSLESRAIAGNICLRILRPTSARSSSGTMAKSGCAPRGDEGKLWNGQIMIQKVEDGRALEDGAETKIDRYFWKPRASEYREASFHLCIEKSTHAIAEGATGATGASAWRSIISIGDSDFEREGCRRAAEDLQKRQAPASQVIHAKTLKSMEKPTVDELTKQLQYISRWLPRMVALCSDLDLTLSDVEDESLQVIEDYLRTLE